MYTKQEEKNLKAVLDFYDVVINGQQYSRVCGFVDKNYIQHKPEVEDGPEGLLDFVRWSTHSHRSIKLTLFALLSTVIMLFSTFT